MNTQRKLFVAALACAAIVAVVIVVRGAFAPSDLKSKSETASAKRADKEDSVAPAAPLPVASTAQPEAVRRAELTPFGLMAREFESARDLRIFVESAKQRPQEGGFAYAAAAVMHCASVKEFDKSKLPALEKKLVASNAGNLAERLAAAGELSRRCSGFTSDELFGPQGALDLYRRGATVDPTIAFRSKAVRVPESDPDERRKLAAEWLAMQDPKLLILLAYRLVGTGQGRDQVVYLDGSAFGGLDASEFPTALEFTECSFGSPCDRFDDRVMRTCIEEGTCFKSRLELYRHWYADKPAQFDEMMKVSARLVEVIRNRDVSAFDVPQSIPGSKLPVKAQPKPG